MQKQQPISSTPVGTSVSGLGEAIHGPSIRESDVWTKMTGCPIAQYKNSMTAGPTGPVLLQDHVLMEKIKQFCREKIPARNVHALGCGAYGQFTVTNDISKYTYAKLFSGVGKTTPLFARFSGIFTEQGDPDTTRDPRGFAIKFYTEEGNWDLMGINTPVFNVRDAKLGPDAVHAYKRDPRTGMWNPTQTWDFTVNHPESLHQALMIFSDRDGTPMSYRYMNAYGCHTFSFVNHEKKRFWVKFHILCNQGAQGLTAPQAKLLAGEDSNFLSRDLFNAIAEGNFPTWKLCCQIMPEEEGYQKAWTFDPTKVWKHSDYPLIDIGIIEINRNPIDYFSEVEQVAFAPTNIVPGLGFSPDKLLQGRLLIYDDTQHHRLGPNYKQLPINRPRNEPVTNYVGGYMHIDIKDKFPHYHGSSFGTPREAKEFVEPPFRADGPADFYDPLQEGTDEDYYAQPRDFWNTLNSTDKNNLCYNIAASLSKVTSDEVIRKALFHFTKISLEFGNTIQATLGNRESNLVKKTESEVVLDEMNLKLGVRGKRTERLTYRGELKNGTRHGNGEYVYENKFFKYVGQWLQGRKHGNGRFELKDGTVYEGEFNNGEIIGKGRKIWPDGREYEGFPLIQSISDRHLGYFQDGEANGEGVWMHPKGEKCEGQWKNNKLHGKVSFCSRSYIQGFGKRFCANGDVYEGSFCRHLYHGEGKLVMEGTSYEGQFDSGKFHGNGKISHADGNWYHGSWSMGQRHGKGTFYDSLNSFTYDGQWNNGIPSKMATLLQISSTSDTTIVLDSAEIPPIQLQCITSDYSLVVEETGRPISVSLRSVSSVPSRKPKRGSTANPVQVTSNQSSSKEPKATRNVPAINTEIAEQPPLPETALPSPSVPPMITLSSAADNILLTQNDRVILRNKNGVVTFSELKVPQELEGDFQLVFADDMAGLEPEGNLPWGRLTPASVFMSVSQKKKGRQ